MNWLLVSGGCIIVKKVFSLEKKLFSEISFSNDSLEFITLLFTLIPLSKQKFFKNFI